DRAVMAALQIGAAMRNLTARARPLGDKTLRARIGIHPGYTVLDAMVSSNRSDISLFGLTANVAARIEAFATPGTVAISDTAMRVLRGSYVLTELGSPDLKGVTQKLLLHQVHGMRMDRQQTAGSAPLTMVGRRTERDFLRSSFEKAQTMGTQSLLISGEPGVGKSTLVRSLRTHLEETPHVWLELQCSELAQSSPLRPVIEGLRDVLEIADEDAPDEQLAKLRDGFGDQVGAMASVEPYLADLLAIELSGSPGLEGLSGELRRVRTLDALVEWAGVAATQSPLVIVAEDLHWADPSTLELLHRLRSRGWNKPILVVGTSRVEDVAPDVFSEHTHIRLARLSIAESRSLATALSAKYDVPDGVLLQLADRGDGVPLFIEEL